MSTNKPIVVVVGAGSREFGPAILADILLSETLCEGNVDVVLMDTDAATLPRILSYGEKAKQGLNRAVSLRGATSLEDALPGADFVVSAIEIERYRHWSQDFHIPRKYGFHQVYGENGGPGGLFHALRNIGPTVRIARMIEKTCPDAVLLNFTNPLTKLCQALTALSPVVTIGLCHGVYQGMRQVARFLDRSVDELEMRASGLNHFTWFESIRERKTGKDLYPELRAVERKANWLAEWDEIALSRILMRTYGLYPSPGANHIGEYLGFASEFLASDRLQFFHDRRDGAPWDSPIVPTWIYNLESGPTATPLFPEQPIVTVSSGRRSVDDELRPSGELAIPIIESLAFGVSHDLNAVNIPNSNSYVPGLPSHTVVEVPAMTDRSGLAPIQMSRLPEGILAIMRTQAAINDLLVEAFSTGRREPLLQALLIDPVVDSYQRAVEMIDEFFAVQSDVLPPLRW